MKKFSKAFFVECYINAQWVYEYKMYDDSDVLFWKEFVYVVGKSIGRRRKTLYQQFKKDVEQLPQECFEEKESMKDLIIKWFSIREDKYDEVIKEAYDEFLDDYYEDRVLC